MAVYLKDGVTYVVEENLFKRTELLMFFLEGHRDDIVALYNKAGEYVGIITYKSLLNNATIENAVITEKINIKNVFGEGHNARNVLYGYADKLIPVFDDNGNMIYFAAFDIQSERDYRHLQEMKKYMSREQYGRLKCADFSIHIKGMNEVLYCLRRFLISMGVYVTVEGEQWEAFGVDVSVPPDHAYTTISIGSQWIEILYREYKNIVWEEKERWNDFCQKSKDQNTSLVFDIYTDSYCERAFNALLAHGLIPEGICTPDEQKAFSFFLGREFMDKGQVRQMHKNAILCLICDIGQWWMEYEIVKLVQMGYVVGDNLFILSELEFFNEERGMDCVLANEKEMVVCGEIDYYNKVFSPYLEQIGFDGKVTLLNSNLQIAENICVNLPEFLQSKKNVIWLYMGMCNKSELQKLFDQCTENHIYLSLYFMIYPLDTDKGVLSEMSISDEFRSQLEFCTGFKKKIRRGDSINMQGDVVFFMVHTFPYICENMKILFDKYREKGISCTWVAANSYDIMYTHGEILRNRMMYLFDAIEQMGGYILDYEEYKNQRHLYNICFLCSDFTDTYASLLHNRKIAKKVVSVQNTAYYTDIYGGQTSFKETFGKNKCALIDHFVSSKFVADWLCDKQPQWKEKILTFGYPRLDLLYQRMQKRLVIRDDWVKKIRGRKVILFVTDEIAEYVEYFERHSDVVMIWRPYPPQLDMPSVRSYMEKIQNMENGILDTERLYDMTFQVADAIVSPLISSVMINFMYTEKPVCIVCDKFELCRADDERIRMEEEAWFLGSYAAWRKEEVEEFITMIKENKDVKREEHLPFRKYMVQNFDGKSCERIYEYFFDK